ncbi:MAG: diadenylate cyclase CdaA [Peptococcaceae bacterium]|jgi:diadenylate cyclase|nr:diadenylate cyclase CdaA [Peptococcaceae bacterium]
MLERFLDFLSLRNAIDIAIISYLFYKVITMVRQTRAMQLLKGVLVLLVVAFISNSLQIQTLSWLLAQFQTMLIVALPVIFQPELRKALERLGQGSIFGRLAADRETMERMIGEIIRAVRILSKSQTGVLLVMERSIKLSDYADTGVIVNSDVSCEMLENLFFPKAALHDGATIIRGDRIYAAGCFLPLSENPAISKSLGTRHRAALGLSEVSDAFIIVVSEETGVISVVEEGRMTRYLSDDTLRDMLLERFGRPPQISAMSIFADWRKNVSKK